MAYRYWDYTRGPIASFVCGSTGPFRCPEKHSDLGKVRRLREADGRALPCSSGRHYLASTLCKQGALGFDRRAPPSHLKPAKPHLPVSELQQFAQARSRLTADRQFETSATCTPVKGAQG